MLYFHVVELWVAWSVSLPSCSSQFICTQMWYHLLRQLLPRSVCQLLPCHTSSPPGSPSLSLLQVWMNVSSLTSWLSDFHTVWFSCISGYVLFLNLLLSFFWLFKEAKCIHLHLHLHQKRYAIHFCFLLYIICKYIGSKPAILCYFKWDAKSQTIFKTVTQNKLRCFCLFVLFWLWY